VSGTRRLPGWRDGCMVPAMLRPGLRSIIHRRAAGLGACLVLAAMPLAAGALPPPALVHDDARLFDDTSLAAMSRVLEAARRDCGTAIHVATLSYFETAGTRNHEQELMERWLKDEPGLLVIYNRGNGQTSVVASPEYWRSHPADAVAQVLADASRVLNQGGISPEHRIGDAARLIADRSRQIGGNRPGLRAPLAPGERTLAIALAGALVLAGLLAARSRRGTRNAAGGPFLFPDATVKPRLGAPFGGGVAGESSAQRPG
jgi:hypothetical protein